MKNIYALTGPTPKTGYVGYISINAKEAGIEVVVRSEGDPAPTGVITLTPEQCEHLAIELLAHINGEPEQAAQAAVSQGWKLVPEKATAQMLEAAEVALKEATRQHGKTLHDTGAAQLFYEAYRAMLSAAPAPVEQKANGIGGDQP